MCNGAAICDADVSDEFSSELRTTAKGRVETRCRARSAPTTCPGIRITSTMSGGGRLISFRVTIFLDRTVERKGQMDTRREPTNVTDI